MATTLSIVIPAYNEGARIQQTLLDILEFASLAPYKTEVIVVDDGSRDRTPEIVSSLVDQYRRSGCDLRLLTNTPNRGKGYSVKRGMTEAVGEIVLFTDADLSAPITEAPKLVDPIATNRADITFGSRALDRSLIGVHQPVFRDFGGRIFNLLLRMITWMPFKDTQCGFKAFRRELALPIFHLQRIERFGFDPELLYIARKHGLRLQEIPVIWNHYEGSTLSYFSDSVKMFTDLAMIRLNDLRGRYDYIDDTAQRQHRPHRNDTAGPAVARAEPDCSSRSGRLGRS
ncbi:MAG TPA: dolichyl-phosphate beta-glucosyltransferase [Blastocatellia bacterium]|nr:dolichyl-phosphate beta-glucosyltransferase [Blastocatellia bacterium]